MHRIEALLKERILVIDGAMGTMLQRYGLTEEDFRGERFADHPSPLKGNNDLLCLTQPSVVQEVHEKYCAAGADIIETNTFNANAMSQADYDLEHLVYELNVAGAMCAKKAVQAFSDKERFVAGVLGPTNRSASLSPDVNKPGWRNVTYMELVKTYALATRGLLDGGADAILVETVFDSLNAKAALYAVMEVYAERGITRDDVPLMISGTITDASGRTLSGQTDGGLLVPGASRKAAHHRVQLRAGRRAAAPRRRGGFRLADTYVSAHPNAGLPNEIGEYDQDPETMAELL